MWVSLFPREHPRLTKRKTNTFPPPGFQLPHADLTVLPLLSRLSQTLHDPKTIAYSCIRNASPNAQTKCPKPNRLPKARASLRRPCPMPDPYTRILSAYPQLSKQRKYRECGERHHFQQPVACGNLDNDNAALRMVCDKLRKAPRKFSGLLFSHSRPLGIRGSARRRGIGARDHGGSW